MAGIGSRFWPMSSENVPKPFLDVLGTGKSLLQMTVDRFLGICSTEQIWVVTSKAFKEQVQQQLPMLPKQNILLEPCRRNTAPCIAYVSWVIKSIDPTANIVVTPSDHVVTDVPKFRQAITESLDFTAQSDAIVTLGMQPDRPETGYGYIEADLSYATLTNKNIFRVDSLKEKPTLEVAQQYIQKPNRTSTEQQQIDELFPTCESISVDYAIMEHADEIYVYPAEFGWSDLGSWSSLHRLMPKDEYGNALIGPNIRVFETANCIIHTTSEQEVVVQGLDGYIVVEKDGTLLVTRMDQEQRIKLFH